MKAPAINLTPRTALEWASTADLLGTSPPDDLVAPAGLRRSRRIARHSHPLRRHPRPGTPRRAPPSRTPTRRRPACLLRKRRPVRGGSSALRTNAQRRATARPWLWRDHTTGTHRRRPGHTVLPGPDGVCRIIQSRSVSGRTRWCPPGWRSVSEVVAAERCSINPGGARLRMAKPVASTKSGHR